MSSSERLSPTADGGPSDPPDNGVAPKRKASTSPTVEDAQAVSPKRTKLDGTAATQESPRLQGTKSPSRRLDSVQEEKKRGKRLFGGLLSTLSQTTGRSQQRKRQDIERRQQERAHQQQAEDDKHREEKLAKITARRRRDQIKFDEQVMRTRHSNMLSKAKYLQTRSYPKIYYLPWKLTDDEKDMIDDQIQDAEEDIDRELVDFKRNKADRLQALGIAVPTEQAARQSPEKSSGAKADLASEDNSAAPPERVTKSSPGKGGDGHSPDHVRAEPANEENPHVGRSAPERDADETGDVMVEEEEDTVIY